jgi:hypothetical protein
VVHALRLGFLLEQVQTVGKTLVGHVGALGI